MAQILIIEDEAEIRETVADILRFEGYDVLEAPDGKEGLELISQHLPDLILCDILMPEVDGYQVLGKLKEDSKTSHIPLIFVSARTSDEDVARGVDAGATAYLTKPFRPEKLLEMLVQYLA